MNPFREGDTYSTLAVLIEKVVAEINALDNDYVSKASPTELEQYFVDKVFVRPLVLHLDDRHIEDQAGINVDEASDVVIVNTGDTLAPAATVTEAGTVTPGSPLDRFTTVSTGAGPLSVRAQADRRSDVDSCIGHDQ